MHIVQFSSDIAHQATEYRVANSQSSFVLAHRSKMTNSIGIPFEDLQEDGNQHSQQLLSRTQLDRPVVRICLSATLCIRHTLITSELGLPVRKPNRRHIVEVLEVFCTRAENLVAGYLLTLIHCQLTCVFHKVLDYHRQPEYNFKVNPPFQIVHSPTCKSSPQNVLKEIILVISPKIFNTVSLV
jgi:hypothetical protein